jgi:hypothetical protein
MRRPEAGEEVLVGLGGDAAFLRPDLREQRHQQLAPLGWLGLDLVLREHVRNTSTDFESKRKEFEIAAGVWPVVRTLSVRP